VGEQPAVIDWDVGIGRRSPQSHLLAVAQHAALGAQRAEAKTRTHEISDDGHQTVLFDGHPANQLYHAVMILPGAVGEVEADHIQTRPQQLAQNLGAPRSGTKRRHDLGSSHHGGEYNHPFPPVISFC
jgi:hypothetical protein